MKMSDELFGALKDAVEPLDTQKARNNYLNADLSDERYRWDLFWAATRQDFNINDLYNVEGLKDSHVDTALRKIVPPLKEKND